MTLERKLQAAFLLVAFTVSALCMTGTVFLIGAGISLALSHVLPGTSPQHAWDLLGHSLPISVAAGTILASLAAIALSLVLSRLLSRSIAGEVTSVVEALRRVAHGDYAVHVAVREGGELGELAYGFNRMAEALRLEDERRAELFGAIAHDLRTPLTTLAAQLEGMLTGLTPADVTRLGALHTDIGRLSRMVEDLLLLARARAERLPVRPRPTDLLDLTASSVARFGPVAEARGVRLAFEPEDPLQAEVDPDRIDQILGNLLANALRYATSSVRMSLRREAGHAVWTVEDDGPGFAPGLLATAKEPFVRGDPARGRDGMAGLGLAIAEALARAHSGDLRLGRTIDGGARVVVSIPEEAKATEAPSRKLHTGNTEGSRGRDTLGPSR